MYLYFHFASSISFSYLITANLCTVSSTGLCFIQPFMALCRCSPTDKNRPIFNWLHWFVGNSAQILGITAIFFGFEFISTPKWVVFILIIFIAFHCLMHLILSVSYEVCLILIVPFSQMQCVNE